MKNGESPPKEIAPSVLIVIFRTTGRAVVDGILLR
jgi:hypothetical protein